MAEPATGPVPAPTRAVILGVEHPRDAAAIRSLAKAGIPVDVADDKTPPTAMWRASRLIRNKYLIPEGSGEATLEALEELGHEDGGLLIPTNDQFLVLASKHYERLSKVFTVTVPPWDVLEPLMNKTRCRELATEVGIEAPRQFHPHSPEALDEAISQLNFESYAYVLKMQLWYDGAANPRTLRRVTEAGTDAASLRESCREIYSRTSHFPVIEEVVTGGADRCIGVSMIVDRHHEPVVAYCVQRLMLHTYAKNSFRHPYELGANAYCESMHDDEAVEQATTLVRHAKFFGAITVEFRRDPVDGRLKLIKADPRFVRATRLSSALGLDMPRALYETFSSSNQPRAYPRNYRDGVAWIWLEAYLYALWKNRRDQSTAKELIGLLKRLPRVGAFAYFDRRDPLPCLLLMMTAGKRLNALENRGTPGAHERPASG